MERVRLIQARRRRFWKLEEAAARLSVDKATLMRWEKGLSSPQPINLQRLCEVYEASLEQLGLENGDSCAVFLVAEEIPVFQQFQQQDLTIRLMRLVWQWKSRNTQYPLLQAQISQELLMHHEDPITRRDALRRLALLPIEMSGLSLLGAVLRVPNEEILAQCAAGVTACWHLGRGKELAFTFDVVSRYIPTLKAIIQAATAKQRKAAASLLAQCLRLKAALAQHVGVHNDQALAFATEAELYSEVAENVVLQVLSARAQANAHDYAGRSKNAQIAAEKARHLLEAGNAQISPLVASHVYAGLANYQAQNGHAQQSMRSLQKAYDTYFLQEHSDVEAPMWVDCNQGNLLLHDGLAHLYLGKHKDARDSFAKIGGLEQQERRETTRVEALIDQALAELYRDDQPRDMDFCIDHWSQGLAGAIAIQSQQRYSEAIQVYNAMCVAWPGEARIKALKESIVHW